MTENNTTKKVELEGKLIIYSSQHCDYCRSVKTELNKVGIEFEEIITSENTEEWNAVSRFTGMTTVPTLLYQGEYFVPARDYGNPQGLIHVLSNYKPSKFDVQERLMQKLTTLNYNMSNAFNQLFNGYKTLNEELREIREELTKKEEKDVNESTD